jgi:nicotinamide-nucleotide adenylyltransferase
VTPSDDGRWPLACVTGRFQPLHLDHLELLLRAAQRADELVVAITNPDPGARREAPESAHRHRPEANPFTFFERSALVRAALLGAGVEPARWRIVPFPLPRPEVWHDYVPPGAVQVVRAYSDWERAKAAQLEAGGYPVWLLDGDPAARRTATELRDLLATGGAWREQVPPATVALLEGFLAARSLADRAAS